MRFGQILVVSAALMAVSTAAAAFQEQQGGATTTPGQAAPAANSAKQPNTQFATPEDLGGTSKGTEVRIPGLGKLGVLPKMDFGLELLYGAASEPKSENARPDTTSEDGDLRIRGTVKHRF